MAAVAALPRASRRHLRLVRDDDRMPDGCWLPTIVSAATGYQPSLSGVVVPVGDVHARCVSRGPRIARAARQWLAVLALALESSRLNPIERLATRAKPRAYIQSRRGRRLHTVEEYAAKPRNIPKVALTAFERDEMIRDLADLERQGIDTSPPANFGECMDDEGPCPWVSCAAHLAYEVDKDGTIKRNFPGLEVWEMTETCSIKVAMAHPDGMTLEEAGARVNLTTERTRQVEAPALAQGKSFLEKRKAEKKHDDDLIQIWLGGRDDRKR